MIKIGDLARRVGITVKTLHHYDDIGLLKPAKVDPMTGYRYYVPEQEALLNRILALKDLGLSLEQVGHLLHSDLKDKGVREILQNKHTGLRNELRNVQARLTRVETHLKMILPEDQTTKNDSNASQHQKKHPKFKDNKMSQIQEITEKTYAEFTDRLMEGRKNYLPMTFGTTAESTAQTDWLNEYNDQYAYLIDPLPDGECTYVLRRADHRAALWFSFILPSNWDRRFELLDASLPNLIAWFEEQDAYRYFYAQLGLESTPPTFLEAYLPTFIRNSFHTEYRMNMHRPAKLPMPDPVPLPDGATETDYSDGMYEEIAVFAHNVYTAEGVNYSLENARRCVGTDDEVFCETATFLRNDAGDLIGTIWWGLDDEPHLGEFLVSKSYQGRGYGRYLLNKAIRQIKRRFPNKIIRLGTCREWVRARMLMDKNVNDRPNVLILMSDQHRANLMTCNGNDLVPTPHIDRIAEQGVRFKRAYCPYPVCVASRMALLTGLYAHHTGVIDNADRWANLYPVDEMPLPDLGDLSGYPKHILQRIEHFQERGDKRLRAHRAGYLGSLAFVDTCIGYVYDGLKDLGLLDNTIVVYTSDHGDMDGDHGLFQKFCLFEPSVQVPLIVSYPEKLPKNRVSEALTEYFGLHPTLSELAGLDAPQKTTLWDMPGAREQIDAVSFLDVLQDPDLKDQLFGWFHPENNVYRPQ